MVIASGCGMPGDWGTDLLVRSNAATILLAVEHLEAPAVAIAKPPYRPERRFSLPSGGEAIGFVATVAGPPASRLEVELVDVRSGVRRAAVRIALAAGLEAWLASAQPGELTGEAAALLNAGTAVYSASAAGQPAGQSRITILIPASLLSEELRVEVFGSRAGDGTPVGSDFVRLVRDFLYAATIGDSVLWGNGLEERDKIHSLVAGVLERETGRAVVMQHLAQTGAKIVPGVGDAACPGPCSGEVPPVPTSITLQADLIQRPDLVELVLMDGCINDVSLRRILSPQTSLEQLENLTWQFCEGELTALLRKVRGKCPAATIIVTGYYAPVGPDSNADALQAWESARGFLSSASGASLVEALTLRSEIFAATARVAMQIAATRVATESAPAGVTFVDPGFGPENATFAPQTLLWGLTRENPVFSTLDLGINLFPEDPLQSMRIRACFQPQQASGLVQCLYASVGHPNRAGAARYAEAIVAALRAEGLLSPPPAASPGQ